MAEKRDISKLTKTELTEMLQRQEKLLQNQKFLRSLPDRGEKVHDLVKRLKEMIVIRGQTEDLTTRFHQISINQSKKPNQGQSIILDSDDDDDDDCTASMDDEPKSESRSSSKEDSKQHSKWAYESAVTCERKPKFEKSKAISLQESIQLQQTQKNEYEELRAKQAAERLMKHKNPASSYSSLTFSTQEAKERYRDTVQNEEIQEDDSDLEDFQQQEESDDD